MSNALKSSVIESYDISGADLLITFKGGNTYGYSGAAHLAGGLRTAPSAGQFFRTNILNRFSFVKL